MDGRSSNSSGGRDLAYNSQKRHGAERSDDRNGLAARAFRNAAGRRDDGHVLAGDVQSLAGRVFDGVHDHVVCVAGIEFFVDKRRQ